MCGDYKELDTDTFDATETPVEETRNTEPVNEPVAA